MIYKKENRLETAYSSCFNGVDDGDKMIQYAQLPQKFISLWY